MEPLAPKGGSSFLGTPPSALSGKASLGQSGPGPGLRALAGFTLVAQREQQAARAGAAVSASVGRASLGVLLLRSCSSSR